MYFIVFNDMNSEHFSYALRCSSLYVRVGEAIYYRGPHELYILSLASRKSINFTLKFYLYVTIRKRDFS